MDIIPRSAWLGGLPFSGPGYDRTLVHTVVYHFPGTTWSKVPTLESALQSAHRYYLSNRGYSLGYGYGIDAGGRVAEIRGTQYRNAANVGTRAKTNTSNFNPFSIAQWFLVNIRDRATDAALDAAARNHVRLEDVHGRQLWVKGHRDVGDTTCPGAVYAQLDELRSRIVEVRKPKPAPVPPPPADGAGATVAHGWYKRDRDEWPYSIALKVYGTAMAWPIIVEDNPEIMTGPFEDAEWIELRNDVNDVVTHSVVGHVRPGETLTTAMRRLYPGVDVADRIGPTAVWSKIADVNKVFPGQLISIPVKWKAP